MTCHTIIKSWVSRVQSRGYKNYVNRGENSFGNNKMGRLEKKINGLRYIKILNNNLDFQGQFQNKLLFQHDNNPIHNSVLPENG